MPKFPVDAPRARVIKVFQALGFHIVRDAEHRLQVLIPTDLAAKHDSRQRVIFSACGEVTP